MLKSVGLRRTPVRVGVLELLSRSARPMGVAEVLGRLPDHTDEVTVYRTLNTFTREKLVHRVRGADRSWRYALGTAGGRGASSARARASAAAATEDAAPHGHAHFVCDTCGNVECLEAARIPKGLVASLHVGPRYAVRYPEVLLHGQCPKCRT